MPSIAVIGGSGLAHNLLEVEKEVKVHTPFGSPSDLVMLGKISGIEVAFLPRHGRSHSIQPGRINFRANIWALKELGVSRILSCSAVGSLQDNVKPGDFVFPDQFIDLTKVRPSTFYEGSRICHVSVADPFCPELRSSLFQKSQKPFHREGTYICIEGPRFSTRAESRLFRSWGCSVIGMTLVPECILAREAEICYSPISMVTDYDTFKGNAVSIDEVLKTMKGNEQRIKSLLADVIPAISEERKCPCKSALKEALL